MSQSPLPGLPCLLLAVFTPIAPEFPIPIPCVSEKNVHIGPRFGLCYRWFGKCWHIHDLLKYEFDIEFDVSMMEWRYGG